MSTSVYLILAILSMATVTFITRIVPTILPKKLLNARLFVAINQALPLTVMTLLILSSLQWRTSTATLHFGLSVMLIAQLLSLIIVLISYHVFRQLLVSMVIGLACLNGLLYVLQNLS